MRNLLIAAAIFWTLASAAVPMLEDWDLGAIDTIGSNQIERIQE